MKTRIEAEGGEGIIRTQDGTVAIIPRNKWDKVRGYIERGMFDMVDDIVSTLPSSKGYAKQGSFYKDPLEPSVDVLRPVESIYHPIKGNMPFEKDSVLNPLSGRLAEVREKQLKRPGLFSTEEVLKLFE